MLRSTFLGFSLALAMTFGAAKSADAAPFTVTIERTGESNVVVSDNGGGDTSPAPNQIIYTNTNLHGDGINLTVTANSNYPGTAALAQITQTTIEFTNTSSGEVTLTIITRDRNFTDPNTPALDVTNSLGVSFLSANSSASSYTNIRVPGNTADTPTTSISTGPSPAFAGPLPTFYFGFNRFGSNFDLTNYLTLTLAAGGNATVTATSSVTPNPTPNPDQHQIPEPVSLAVWGLGLGAMGLVRLRRRRASVTA